MGAERKFPGGQKRPLREANIRAKTWRNQESKACQHLEEQPSRQEEEAACARGLGPEAV